MITKTDFESALSYVSETDAVPIGGFRFFKKTKELIFGISNRFNIKLVHTESPELTSKLDRGAFHLSATSTQSIPAGGAAIISFDTAVVDDLMGADIINYGYIIPAGVRMTLSATASLTACTTASQIGIQIRGSVGTSILGQDIQWSNPSMGYGQVSCQTPPILGDGATLYYVRVYHADSASRSTYNGLADLAFYGVIS